MMSAALVGVDAAQTYRLCDIDVAEPNDRQVASQIDTILDVDVDASTLPIDHEPQRRAVRGISSLGGHNEQLGRCCAQRRGAFTIKPRPAGMLADRQRRLRPKHSGGSSGGETLEDAGGGVVELCGRYDRAGTHRRQQRPGKQGAASFTDDHRDVLDRATLTAHLLGKVHGVQPQADQLQPVVRTLAGLVIDRRPCGWTRVHRGARRTGDGLRQRALVIIECDRHRASWVLWGTGSTHRSPADRAGLIIEVSSIQVAEL